MTGPGWASTTRTSTPKSLSFFSIMRLVISSVSTETVSWFSWASSSSATCGKLLSGISTNKGFCRSLATRWLGGKSSGLGLAISTGSTCCSTISSRSSLTISSRSRMACRPISRSWAISRFSRTPSQADSMRAPKCSQTPNHEKWNTHGIAIRHRANSKTPDPAKPSMADAAPPTP